MTVIKRSGAEEKFDSNKILKAITKANVSVPEDERLDDLRLKAIVSRVEHDCIKTYNKSITTDFIDDTVEKLLMRADVFKVAKLYITYRYEKEKSRNKANLKEKLTASNVQNQNANVDEHSFGGRMGETAEYILKEYALNNLVSAKSKRNHNNNEIYIHDLSHYALGDHNCAERNMWVKVKIDSMPKLMKIGDLGDLLGVGYDELVDTSKSNIYILSRDGWTKLINIAKRKTRYDEKLYTFKTRTGLPVKVTENHRLPVIREGKEILLAAKDIKIGDSLLDIENVKLSGDELNECFLNLTSLEDSESDIRVTNLAPLNHYLQYKYNITVNGFLKSKGYKPDSGDNHCLSMKLWQFNILCNEYPLSFDILSELRLKENGSKHYYPLHIPFTRDLAKLYGYIYGDGGVYIRKRGSLYQLTFTNTNKDIMEDFVKCYENVFGYSLNISYPSPTGTSPCMRVTDGSLIPCRIFKNFAGAKKYGAADISIPDFIMNGANDIKYAFLAAAIDTDGNVGDSSLTYTTCGEKYSEQILFLLQGLGYHPNKVIQYSKGTKYNVFGKTGLRNFNIYHIKMYRADEICDLLSRIQSFKGTDKFAFRGLTHKFNENKIYSIQSNTGDYDVFDVETGSHWFILNNYVSHNCLSVPIDVLLEKGFNTRQTDVRGAKSLNTAFQLVAVLFQLQSLQQFGGVSATHLDWSMVPYFRLSFYKHYKDGLKYIEGMSEEDIKNFENDLLEESKQHEKD